MNENLKKVAEMLKNDLSLKEKLTTETKRLAESMKDKDVKEIEAQAIRNVLGIDITAADLEAKKSEIRELSPEQMGKVAGGGDDIKQKIDEFEQAIQDFLEWLGS